MFFFAILLSPYFFPCPCIRSTKGHAPRWSSDSSTSEVATIQLEFRDLSRSLEDYAYEEVAMRVSDKIHSLPKLDGLVPIFINANTGKEVRIRYLI